jgi:hypothetical protein
MPRFVTKRRKPLSTKERVERAKKIRTNRESFIDPFPEMHGTLPEKMVYAALSMRRIPFLFLNDVHFVFPEIDFDKYYQADFVLPDYKIIIEVQGAYWHSMEKEIESDAFKFAVYEMAGYTILAWWDYDIYSNLAGLFAQNPVLAGFPSFDLFDQGASELPVVRRTKVDTSQGIRTMNERRGLRGAYKRKAVRQKIKKA